MSAKRALQALRDGVLCAQQRYAERHPPTQGTPPVKAGGNGDSGPREARSKWNPTRQGGGIHRCWRAGQHSAEFAVLLGIVATTGVVMQSVVRHAVEQGIMSVTEQVLGADTQVRQDKRQKDKDVSSIDLANPPRSSESVTITGDQDFKRVTTISGSSVGANINESCEARVGAVNINCNTAQ